MEWLWSSPAVLAALRRDTEAAGHPRSPSVPASGWGRGPPDQEAPLPETGHHLTPALGDALAGGRTPVGTGAGKRQGVEPPARDRHRSNGERPWPPPSWSRGSP